MIERLRIGISRVFVLLIIGMLCLGESYWDGKEHMMATLMLFVGIFLVVVASVGRLWCSLYIAGYKTDCLVTKGPYSMCRNPLYFFSFIGAVGVGFASETFLLPFLISAGFALYYPLVIRSEEKELMRLHRNGFESYVNSVPRFFPRISLLAEPEGYLVKPVIFRKHILDVIWFGWMLGVIEVIEASHRLGVLPTLFKIV